MKERPIIFSAPMVRAILDGSKTQTRRVAPISDLKIQRDSGEVVTWSVRFTKPVKGVLGSHSGGIGNIQPHNIIASQFSPYGRPRDRLWVRETFADESGGTRPYNGSHIFYKADCVEPLCYYWKPSLHMPRWASRITLEITNVRVEQLQDIKESDAWEEGCVGYDDDVTGGKSGYNEFAELWKSINGPESWDANPWVWVVEFKRV